MIRVFSQWETVFDNSENDLRLGLGVLTPTECTISEEAGGQYDMSITHPIDPAGAWKLITPFALIAAPIPQTSTPFIDQSSNTIIGAGLEVWAASTDNTGFYNTKRGTRYKSFKNGEGYSPGDRVSYGSWNWQCLQFTYTVPSESAAWKKLSRTTPTPVSKIPNGELFIVSEKETISSVEWLTITRLDGSTGFAKSAEAEYQYTAQEDDSLLEDVPARELTVQLFRVMDVTIDSKSMTVKATAQHVSYDWSMALVDKITLKDTELITAIAAIRTAMMPDGLSSAPHIYAQNTDSTVTATINRRALTNVILDPDEGLVTQAKARLVRDGYDFFLLKNEPADQPDRGFSVRYGVNLRGVTWRRDYSKLVTRIMPVGKDANDDELLLDDVYVDSDYRGEYPIDMYQVIQVDAKVGEDDATEADVKEKMETEALKMFNEDQVDRPDTTLTIEFLLLGDTAEYAQYKGLERVSLYDRVTVEHPDLGLTTTSQVKSYEWDAIRKRYNKITLGNVFESPTRTVYGYGIADGAISLKKLSAEAIDAIRNG